ncbi:ligand-binding sensor domain-containing protein [Colwellia hornerae]|uniref:ligand-binding sensor domain-containing protein n=1 Tax=Colwellia hornerae TaxID=89402 RepID=UPI0014792157|nr:ligand-binding sensor domain-containing diguanylate cyclase [Colwellia hornerae]
MKYLSLTVKVLSLSFFLCCFSAYSVNLSTVDSLPVKTSLALSDYFTETWNTPDGLPHNGINAISQTTDGYLWIGTWEGLARFNGREFKVFTRGSKIGLPDSVIKSLTSTQEGELLVAGARGGLSVRSNKQWLPQPSSSTMINDAIYDNNKNIWLALEGKGLIYRNKDTKKDTIIIDNIEAFKIVQDNEGIIWVATSKGLFSVKNKTLVRHIDERYGLPNSPAHTIILTKEKQLIVGTQQGAYKLVKGIFQPLHKRLANEKIISLLQDSDLNIWLGTNNHGIFKLSKNELEQLDESNGLPNNRVSSLYQDNEQSIWVGTSNGLFRLREMPFITLTTKQGLSGNFIRSVLSHSDGSLWVGSSKGLNKINKGLISTIKVAHSNEQLSVLSLAETPDKQVLVGTYTQGLYAVTNNKLQKLITTENGLPSNEIRSILVDSTKNIWLGTASGVVKISPDNTIEEFNKQSGLPANFIIALAEDHKGRIWIGTGNGLASYNKGSLQTYHLNDKFDAKYAFGFHVEQNSLWIASDRGLIHINLMTDEMSAVTKENGLPVDKIFQVVIDNNNTFWLSSNRGIISLTRSQINSVIQGKNKSIDYNLFAEGVGLLSSQANGGSTPAATLHDDGSVWIATAKGVSHINHERLQRMAETVLPVVIEQLNVDGKYYPLLSTVELPKGASRITIHYAGLSYLMAKQIVYQSQLIGFDKQWQNKNNQTFTEFTNLEPGNYTFQMRAKYPNGEWQENIASISFTITPFYWQTTSFKLFVIFCFCFSLYSLYRYRMIAIKRSQVKLKNLVAQQTIELQKQAELFSYQANHDQLTGLFNRRAFDGWCNNDFEKAKLANRPLTIAMLDIDHFKKVNDDYSHLIGDQVIKRIANILHKIIQDCSTETKLARWGGEEFTLLIMSDKEKAYDYCELLRITIKNYDFSDIAGDINITVSIGLTDNSEITEYDKMITRADQALYFAKHNGRNQVRIYQKSE